MRRRRVILLAVLLAVLTAALPAASGRAEIRGVSWTDEARAKLRIGNPTELSGRFFTDMWGGNTSDMDIRALLHAYSPVCYDISLSRFRFDRGVLEDAAALDDTEGNRTYLLVLCDDLFWSDGTSVTASDYAFSVLLGMDPVVGETGGTPVDYSWILGADEYLSGENRTLRGLQVVTDRIIRITARADSLPYFYELSRLRIEPCPASVIAPGISVMDDGEGVYLSEPLTAEMIRRTVLDPGTGYMSHPSVVCGPYQLDEYGERTARFSINTYYKGTESGYVPRIGELEYMWIDNGDIVRALAEGEIGLVNKVTQSKSIRSALEKLGSENRRFDSESYARSGLTILWFMESSPALRETDVRKAVACCFDRDGFTKDYTGMYGTRMDVFSGLGQWMFRLASGQMPPPVDNTLPEAEYEAAAKAFDTLTLDGVTRYSFDPAEAERLLSAAGWEKNGQGVRGRTVNGETTELRLVIGYPASEETGQVLETYLARNLETAGIPVTLKPMTIEEIEKAYRDGEPSADLLYLGENFSILFDPEILAPKGDPEEGGLPADKAELYAMAREMVQTDPSDLYGFTEKWIALQERISQTLPLLPVYSNVYFDFYSRELHGYEITRAVTWTEAILKSYISDIELP